MSTTPVTRIVVIENPQGLHARPAELFARLALKYESRIELIRDDQRVDGKSILEILTLGVQPGTRLTLEAQGLDAQEAIVALAKLVENRFEVSESEGQEQSR
jgi:phosphotransferase system HPr (HPr) family protein